MRLLTQYLKAYWKLAVLALFLAAINQIFSLLDPAIFRLVIDRYATKYHQYTTIQFLRGVSLLLGAAVGVAFVSRVAKNLQDYFVNVIVQRTGATSMPMVFNARCRCHTRCLKISGAARRLAN